MKKGFSKLIALSVLVIAFASCAKVPQAEIDSANAALESARQAGADRYVPSTFNAASEAMKTGQAAVEEQNSKFVLFRNYDASKATFDSVKTLANKAVEETATRKEQLKGEVTQELAKLDSLVSEDKALLAKAPRGKEGKAALEAIGQEISVVETTKTEVNTGLTNNEDILTLSEKLKPAVEKAQSINTELTDVMSKAKGGKK